MTFAHWCDNRSTSSDMTRRLVYGGGLIAFLAGKCPRCYAIISGLLTDYLTALVLTLASIITPRWISWDSETVRLGPASTSHGLLIDIFLLSQAAKGSTTLMVSTAAVPLSRTLANTSPTKKIAMATVTSVPCGALSGFSSLLPSSWRA